MSMKTDRYKMYYPKRDVNNRNSKYIPHVISSYISPLMNRLVECESQAEEIFFSMLEMSISVEEYFHQPVEVPVKVYNPQGQLEPWMHYPDCLVFFEDNVKPCLVQVKGDKEIQEIKPKDVNIFRACEQYARENGWTFRVVYPYTLNETLRLNIKKLFPYTKAERDDETIADMLNQALDKHQIMTIDELLRMVEPIISRQKALSVIWHELALGNLYTDFNKPVNRRSKIRIALLGDDDLYKKLL